MRSLPTTKKKHDNFAMGRTKKHEKGGRLLEQSNETVGAGLLGGCIADTGTGLKQFFYKPALSSEFVEPSLVKNRESPLEILKV